MSWIKARQNLVQVDGLYKRTWNVLNSEFDITWKRQQMEKIDTDAVACLIWYMHYRATRITKSWFGQLMWWFLHELRAKPAFKKLSEIEICLNATKIKVAEVQNNVRFDGFLFHEYDGRPRLIMMRNAPKEE